MPRLDGHDLKALRLDTDWCCSDNDCNGFWFNAHHPEEHWVDAWRKVAKMSLPYKAVLGAGLKNEIRAMISSKSWGSGAFCSAGFLDRGLSVFPEFFLNKYNLHILPQRLYFLYLGIVAVWCGRKQG